MAARRAKSDGKSHHCPTKVLVIDVGGTNVKILVTGKRAQRKVPSGPSMTAPEMVAAVKQLAADWSYDVISLGYPGAVLGGKPVAEPKNLSDGWVGFDFEKAFGCKVKVVNDAAMQALGSYEGGRMLFLGLGTGLGSALITDGVLVPMELAHLLYRKGRTYEDYVGLRGLKRYGDKKWRRYVADVVAALRDALQADYVVLGGGNATKLTRLPEYVRLGDNTHAFLGGFRLWEEAWMDERPACVVRKGLSG
ncbi:MAG TPA: ROK family protein [Nitrospiraceae bacterium]|nr:ROK family protein [Nitrospiraceae bacterium]